MKIGIVIGSVREGRLGGSVGEWVRDQAQGREGVSYEIVDLKDYDLPVLTSPTVPGAASRDYDDERVTRFGQTIDSYDGFVFVTAEYNHGVPGAFKNAFDSIYPEWGNKAVGFVSYGAAEGARAVEAWRLVVANANLYAIRSQVSFSIINHFEDGAVAPADRHVGEVVGLFDQLEALAEVLRPLRD